MVAEQFLDAVAYHMHRDRGCLVFQRLGNGACCTAACLVVVSQEHDHGGALAVVEYVGGRSNSTRERRPAVGTQGLDHLQMRLDGIETQLSSTLIFSHLFADPGPYVTRPRRLFGATEGTILRMASRTLRL